MDHRHSRVVPLILGILQLVVATLTSWIAYVQFEDSSDVANGLRVAIIALMVITAFILIRWDVNRPHR